MIHPAGAGVAWTPGIPGHELAEHRAQLRPPWPPAEVVALSCSCGRLDTGWHPARDAWPAFNEAQQHLADELAAAAR